MKINKLNYKGFVISIWFDAVNLYCARVDDAVGNDIAYADGHAAAPKAAKAARREIDDYLKEIAK